MPAVQIQGRIDPAGSTCQGKDGLQFCWLSDEQSGQFEPERLQVFSERFWESSLQGVR